MRARAGRGGAIETIASTGKALRVGFQKSYEAHEYATIVAIAKKVPADVVESDEKLLRYYDLAQQHVED